MVKYFFLAQRNSLFLFLILFLLNENIAGQSVIQNQAVKEFKVSPFRELIRFDGVPDEDVWSAAEPVQLLMYSPHSGQPVSEQSDVRIGFDDNYLYIGAMLMYEDPSLIRSSSYKRDFVGQGGDLFGVMLDTYNDKQSGLVFLTTPDALRIDGTVQRDANSKTSGDVPYNLSWNTFWDVKTKRVGKGWSAEIRIPISSLRFQEDQGEVRMGIIIQRWIPARNEMDVYPAIPPNWGQASVFKPSQAAIVTLIGIKEQKPLYLTPYILGGFTRRKVSSSEGDGYVNSDARVIEPGLDMKYGITSNLVVDLTVNTDFAQVESDEQQVNLTRYSLYFPEKRLFFLERSSAFDFGFGGNDNLFYSRRIGLSDDGQPVRIYGGARLTGRLGKWDLGILDMQTASYENLASDGTVIMSQPSENFAALRLKRQVINSNSYIGAMLTSRVGMNGTYNIAYGVDGLFRISGDDYLDLKLVRSSDSEVTPETVTGPLRMYALWQRRASVGLGYDISYEYVGTDYVPGMGFERLHGYGYGKLALRYGWLPKRSSVLYSHSTGLENRYFYYASDGSLMTYQTRAYWNFETKNKWTGKFSAELGVENLKDPLSLMQRRINVPPGLYRNLSLSLNVTTPDSKSFYVSNDIETGSYFEGRILSWKLKPTWNASKHLELGSAYNFDCIGFSETGQTVFNHLFGIKALIMVDTRLSFNGYVQYNTGENLISSNFRLRYNPREGNDIYLVFNEGRNYELDLEEPRLPRYRLRSVMLKYTYTFTL